MENRWNIPPFARILPDIEREPGEPREREVWNEELGGYQLVNYRYKVKIPMSDKRITRFPLKEKLTASELAGDWRTLEAAVLAKIGKAARPTEYEYDPVDGLLHIGGRTHLIDVKRCKINYGSFWLWTSSGQLHQLEKNRGFYLVVKNDGVVYKVPTSLVRKYREF